jgi:hypothetical protein
MDDLLICSIMSPLGSRKCALPILQKLLLHPLFSIFGGLLSNELTVDKRGYGHERMKGSLETSGLLWK